MSPIRNRIESIIKIVGCIAISDLAKQFKMSEDAIKLHALRLISEGSNIKVKDDYIFYRQNILKRLKWWVS